jgi:hypothetical protein
MHGYLDDVFDNRDYVIRKDEKKVAIPTKHLSGEVSETILRDEKEGSERNGLTGGSNQLCYRPELRLTCLGINNLLQSLQKKKKNIIFILRPKTLKHEMF